MPFSERNSLSRRPAPPFLVFTLVAIAQFMVVLDTAITSVALPVIKQQMEFSGTSIQWVVTAYVLTFGGFLLLGGRVADLFGRRRTLIGGMLAFTAVSFLIGVSPSAPVLIASRGLQGLAAAFMSPAALSIVLVTFPEGHERRRALGYWSMVATGGAALGLLLGGVLTQYAGWRWNFFINVPVGLAVSVLIARFVPAYGSTAKHRTLDVPGACLVTLGLMTGVLAFSQAPAWGWTDARTAAGLAACVLLLTGFVANERRASAPLMDLSIFKIRNVSGANGMMAAVYAGNLGMFFLLTLYLQGVEHYSAIRTGLAFLPVPVILGFTSTRMAGLVGRFGFRPFLILGPTIVTAGMGWVCFLPVHGAYPVHVLPGLLIMPIGYGMSFAPMYAAATTGIPPRYAGLTSGLIVTSQQMGGALGLAVISGAAASVTAQLLARDTAAQALTTGYDIGMAVSAGFTLLAVVLAITVIRRPRPATESGPETAESPIAGRAEARL